jgi:predicted O-linked N-acetylglucosamine transferase (SPINDLY family)
MRILRQIPGSVLWLLADTLRTADHLRAAATERGVDPDRLIFAPRLPKAEHLERHRLADVFLDTFIVNAHTTASDALWAGLPVLTQLGATFQSRVCASLLSALGLKELIVESDHEYEKLAVHLAANPNRLRELRIRLAARRTAGLPFATEWSARQLEQIYRELWHYH